MTKVLITGGSGMIGTRLTELLVERGFEVAHLGRVPGIKNGIETFKWDYKNNTIDTKAFDHVEYVINLAGANVASKRWSDTYMDEIYRSRVRATRLLIHTLKVNPHRVKKLIQASAIGIYKNNIEGNLNENALQAETFLAAVCKDWEQAANEAVFIKVEPVTLRIGIVLSEHGGFIPKIAKKIQSNFGAITGNGKQQISWIHLDDVCNMMIHLMLYDKAEGVYNGVAAEPVSNKEITTEIAKRLKKSIWLPAIPGFILKLIFGGISEELLSSHHLSSEKIVSTGYEFKYPELKNALDAIFPDTKD